MLPSTRSSSVRTRFRPRLEALEDRALLAVSVSFGNGGLMFTGSKADESVTLNDNGDGTVTYSASGVDSGTVSGVKRIVINLRGGDDTVTYTLSGKLTTGRSIESDLNSGDDVFIANLGGHDLTNGLNVSVTAGSGDDRIELNQIGRIDSGTKFKASVSGNAGDDEVFASMVGDVDGRAEFFVWGNRGSNLFSLNAVSDVDVASGGVLDVRSDHASLNFGYKGELDGKLLLDASGNSDRDTLSANVILDSGSTGRVGGSSEAAKLKGYGDKDTLRFTVVDNSSGKATVNAYIDGGKGSDTGTHTSNVSAFSIETDQVI